MSHYVIQQKHRGVWKTIARRPNLISARKAVNEIRRDVPEARRAGFIRMRKVPD